MKPLTALGLVLSQKPKSVACTVVTDALQFEHNMQEVGADPNLIRSMGTSVPACLCDDCKPLAEYHAKQVRGRQSSATPSVYYTFVGGYDLGIKESETVVISGSTIPNNNGTFKVMGTTTGRMSSSSPNISNTPRSSVDLYLREAFNLASKKSVRISTAKSTRRNRRRWRFRILDHGPNWQDQGCGVRFKLIRWAWPNPVEWERVGWTISKISFLHKKEAAQAVRDLEKVAWVMDA